MCVGARALACHLGSTGGPAPTTSKRRSEPSPATVSLVCLRRKQIIRADQRPNVIIRNTVLRTVQLLGIPPFQDGEKPPGTGLNQPHTPFQGVELALISLLWNLCFALCYLFFLACWSQAYPELSLMVDGALSMLSFLCSQGWPV